MRIRKLGTWGNFVIDIVKYLLMNLVENIVEIWSWTGQLEKPGIEQSLAPGDGGVLSRGQRGIVDAVCHNGRDR